MSSWIERLGCGIRSLGFFGQTKVTKIQNTSTVVLQRGIGKIRLWGLKINNMFGRFNLRRFRWH